jgi:hypothetical protein
MSDQNSPKSNLIGTLAYDFEAHTGYHASEPLRTVSH